MLEEDKQGLQTMRDLIKSFLSKAKGHPDVLSYLMQASSDDRTLLIFLRGRKFQAEYAMQTLKRNTEVRLIECPELFPEKLSDKLVSHLRQYNLMGVLKARDNLGRHVVFFNCGAWDPHCCSLEEVLTAFVKLMELLLQNESFVQHGFVYIQQNSGVEMKHARQYSINAIKKLIKVFWHSFPIQLKCLIYVNVPTLLHYTFSLGRAFFPAKLKERLIITPTSAGFTDIYKVIAKEQLPECLGGPLEFNESMDETIINVLYNIR